MHDIVFSCVGDVVMTMADSLRMPKQRLPLAQRPM
jgi:hypothetical protein